MKSRVHLSRRGIIQEVFKSQLVGTIEYIEMLKKRNRELYFFEILVWQWKTFLEFLVDLVPQFYI